MRDAVVTVFKTARCIVQSTLALDGPYMSDDKVETLVERAWKKSCTFEGINANDKELWQPTPKESRSVRDSPSIRVVNQFTACVPPVYRQYLLGSK